MHIYICIHIYIYMHIYINADKHAWAHMCTCDEQGGTPYEADTDGTDYMCSKDRTCSLYPPYEADKDGEDDGREHEALK